jgi:hypothetical protein
LNGYQLSKVGVALAARSVDHVAEETKHQVVIGSGDAVEGGQVLRELERVGVLSAAGSRFESGGPLFGGF